MLLKIFIVIYWYWLFSINYITPYLHIFVERSYTHTIHTTILISIIFIQIKYSLNFNCCTMRIIWNSWYQNSQFSLNFCCFFFRFHIIICKYTTHLSFDAIVSTIHIGKFILSKRECYQLVHYLIEMNIPSYACCLPKSHPMLLTYYFQLDYA